MRGDPAPLPEIRPLVALAEIARTGSFSAAAEALGYTQSAISQQIRRLERQVGHRLIERSSGPRAVSMTPAGEVMLRHGEAIAARLTSAAADLAALRAGKIGTLRVGCFESAGAELLPAALSAFAREWPQARVELVEAEDDAGLLTLIEAGELDVAYVVLPLPTGPFECVELLDDPYVAVLAKNLPLAQDPGPMALEQLRGQRLASYARMRAPHAIEQRLGRPELGAQIVYRSHRNSTLVGLAEQNAAIAVMSWLSARPTRDRVTIRPLIGVAPRTIGLVWHRDRLPNPMLRAFTALASAVPLARRLSAGR
ncbi:LysR family transcriptional regulator [Actinospica sp. MGRD01-02]|uniref:LysR family transcriptional regulator n=1 Tax=Actinospica acidithermotolerans TaxID=2828514 RepID=A0A941EGI0_9ACTN|nr:LysR family transcriptional regulator [Actinospica acidithermotolerans]MBR7831047.1 LysR family transcriptional regulator [Actinospica acidithermotolerans]